MVKLIDPSTGVVVQADADAAARMVEKGFTKVTEKPAAAQKQSTPKKASKK